MDASLMVTIDSFKKKDGTHRIIIRMIFKRKFAKFPTMYSVLKKDWNEKQGKIKKSCKQFGDPERINAKIYYYKSELYDRIVAIERRGTSVQNVLQLKHLMLNRPVRISYCSYSKILEQELRNMKRLGNAGVYRQARKFIFRLNGYRDVNFEDITYSFLKNIEMMHLSSGNGYNSLSINLRTLRAVYNRAIKEGYAKQEQYPFREYSIKQEKTKKRAVGKEIISLIEGYEAMPGTMKRFARDMFLFSFYTRGMNITDMARLRVGSIVNNRIEYKRQKTGGLFSIPLSDKVVSILGNYIEDSSNPGDYIFPIIKRKGLAMERKDIYNATRNVNKNIQKIAKELGIEEHITTYVARHSWASIGNMKGVPISTISQALGHQDLKTTQIYLEDLDNSALDEADSLITD